MAGHWPVGLLTTQCTSFCMWTSKRLFKDWETAIYHVAELLSIRFMICNSYKSSP